MRISPYTKWWNTLSQEKQNELIAIASEKNNHCGNSYVLAELLELPHDKALWVYKLKTN